MSGPFTWSLPTANHNAPNDLRFRDNEINSQLWNHRHCTAAEDGSSENACGMKWTMLKLKAERGL